MAKFSDIVKGTRARKTGVECTTLSGVPFTFDIRVLSGQEEAAVVAAAGKRAKELGGEAVETDLNFQFESAVQYVAVAATDPESPEGAPVAFFASPDEVRSELDRERIVYIAEVARRFQESVSPRQHELSELDYVHTLYSFAEGAMKDNPFFRWPQSTQNRWLHTFAKDHVTLLELKSRSGMDSNGQASAKTAD